MKKNEKQILKTNNSVESDEYKKLIKLILIISIYQCSVIRIYRAKIATNIDIQEDTL